MLLILGIDLACAAMLFAAHRRGGFQLTLAVAAFLLVIFPEESKIGIGGFFTMTTQRVVTVLLVAMCIVSRPTAASSTSPPLMAGIWALGLWGILSAANSVTVPESAKYMLSQVLDYFVVYYLFAKYVRSQTTVRRVLLAIVAGLAVCAFFGLLETYAQWTVVSLFPRSAHSFGMSGELYVEAARGIRAQSTFGHPILLGSGLAMGIPMGLYLAGVTPSRWQRLFLWTALCLMFGCIYQTGSRGPWLAPSPCTSGGGEDADPSHPLRWNLTGRRTPL